MKFSPSGINWYTFFNLPSAWWSGVRVTSLGATECEVKVRLNWFNKNPFRSMFWAIQGMAAELATAVLIMQAARNNKCTISMLVLNNKATFVKKAKGKIIFKCVSEGLIEQVFLKMQNAKEPQTLWLGATGIDEQGDVVSKFDFEWTLLLKN